MSKTYLMEKLTGQQGKYAVFNSDGSISAQTLNTGAVPQIRITADYTLTNVTVNGIQASGSGTEWYYNCSAYGSYTIIAYQGSNTYTEIIDVKVVKQYTVEAQFALKPEGATFNDCSWANIREIVDYGIAANIWNVGDCHAVALNGTMGTLDLSDTLYMYILGFDHNSTVENNGYAHTLHLGGFKTAVTGGTDVALCDSEYITMSFTAGTLNFNMNHRGTGIDSSTSDYNYGGWKGSDMRYDILGSTNKQPKGYGAKKPSTNEGYDAENYDIINAPLDKSFIKCLPIELRRVMKPIKKYTDNTAGGSNTANYVTESLEYSWLLAEKEIFGSRTYANSAEQNKQMQYAYYGNSGNSKIKYKHNDTTTTCYWWERSPCYDDSISFCIVDTDSDATAIPVSLSSGVAPAVCV